MLLWGTGKRRIHPTTITIFFLPFRQQGTHPASWAIHPAFQPSPSGRKKAEVFPLLFANAPTIQIFPLPAADHYLRQRVAHTVGGLHTERSRKSCSWQWLIRWRIKRAWSWHLCMVLNTESRERSENIMALQLAGVNQSQRPLRSSSEHRARRTDQYSNN